MMKNREKANIRSVSCDRLSLFQMLCSPLGMLILICSVPGLGMPLLIVAFMHFVVMPKRVWVSDGRLFAAKGLPTDGVPIEDVDWVEMDQNLLFWTINRAIRLASKNGQGRILALNQLYFGSEALDKLVAVLEVARPVAVEV